jgi:hypothetical protein
MPRNQTATDGTGIGYLIRFSMNGKCGISAPDALARSVSGLDRRDERVFQDIIFTSTVSLRIEVGVFLELVRLQFAYSSMVHSGLGTSHGHLQCVDFKRYKLLLSTICSHVLISTDEDSGLPEACTKSSHAIACGI